MKKLFSTIVAVVLLASIPAFALAAGPTVVFQSTPLFSQVNFAPGGVVTRWVSVTNNTGAPVDLGAKVISLSDEEGLAPQLSVTIQQGESTLYTGTLLDLYGAGEVPLSSLADNNSLQYDVSVTFAPTSSNSFQGKSLSFDFVIGSNGSGGATPSPTPGPNGGFVGLQFLGSSGGGLTPTPTPSPGTTPTSSGTPTPTPLTSPTPTVSGQPGTTPGPQGSGQPSPTPQGGSGAGLTANISGSGGSTSAGSLLANIGGSFSGNICSNLGRKILYALMILGYVAGFAAVIFRGKVIGRVMTMVIPIALAAVFALWARACGLPVWWAPAAGSTVMLGIGLLRFW